MKKIKLYVFGMLLAMAVFAMAGCSNKDNNTNNTTSAAGTQTTTTQGVTTGAGESSGMGTDDNTNSESSTGVIGGIVDDVERGVNDVVDGTDTTTTHTSDETTK